jgi:hypothetical protein
VRRRILRDEHRDVKRDENQDDGGGPRSFRGEDPRRGTISSFEAPKQRIYCRREWRARDFIYALKTMGSVGPDQGVARGGAQFFQSCPASDCFARRKFTGPHPKLLRVARKFAQPGFEEIRKCMQAAAKCQNRQQTDVVKPDMLWRRVHASGVRREFEEKFVPRPGLAESAQIKWLQGKIGLPDSGRQFAAEPLEQAIPIAADSKRLCGRLAAGVRLAVP